MGRELSAGMKVAAQMCLRRALWSPISYLSLGSMPLTKGGQRRVKESKDEEEVRGEGRRGGTLWPGCTSGTSAYL